MTSSKPEFRLRRIDSDGSTGPTEIYPVTDLPADTQLSRRGLFGIGVTVGSVLALTNPDSASGQPPPGKGTPKKDEARPPAVVYAHSSIVYGLAVSEDGKSLISGSWDKSVKVWSLPEGKLLKGQPGVKVGVRSMAFLPNGKTLAVGTGESTVCFWDPPNGFFSQARCEHATSVCALATAPYSRLLATGSYKTIKLLELPDGKPTRTLNAHSGNVLALAITPDAKTLVSGSDDKTVKFWSLPDGKPALTLAEHAGGVRALTVTPDGKYLASGAADKIIKLWSLPDGKFLRNITGHTGEVNVLAVVPGGKMLVSGSADKTLRLWSLPEGQLVRTFSGHIGEVRAVTVTPDGKTLISGDQEGVIILWDLATGKPQRYLFDAPASKTDAYVYNVRDEATGRTVTYTLPCGTPIPAGATCTCNCVPGSYVPPVVSSPPVTSYDPPPLYLPPAPINGAMGGFRTYCSCNKICTCIPVCQALRVLDDDPLVRTMAEELLLVMGENEFTYMTWAAGKALPPVRSRIRDIMTAIQRGSEPQPIRWPRPESCVPYLDNEDEVVGVMAAQMIREHERRFGFVADQRVNTQVERLLDGARQRPWFVRASE